LSQDEEKSITVYANFSFCHFLIVFSAMYSGPIFVRRLTKLANNLRLISLNSVGGAIFFFQSQRNLSTVTTEIQMKPSGKVALITRVVRVDLYSSVSGLALAFSPFSKGEWRLNDPKTNC